MAITATHLTTGSSDTDTTSYTTASISPSGNKLILAAVWNGATGTNPQPTLTGNGLTWVHVISEPYDVSGTFGVIHLFRAMGASPTPGTVVINYGATTVLACGWSISEFSPVDTGGTNGSAAIVQSLVALGLSAAALVTLSAFSDVGNATYGALAHQTADTETIGAGFNLLGRSTTAVPVTTISTFWKDSNDTTVDATWTDATQKWGIIGVEIKAATVQAADPLPSGYLVVPSGWGHR